jgi:hypothetical protein
VKILAPIYLSSAIKLWECQLEILESPDLTPKMAKIADFGHQPFGIP